MGNLFGRENQPVPAAGTLACLIALLIAGLPASGSAGDGRVPEPVFNEAAATAFPRAIYDEITERIAHQTTFQQINPEGLMRWSTRTIKLVDFVKAPSPTYPDTYLYAMRYVVSVISEEHSLAVYGTSCQVVVVYKDGAYDDPTVVCEPVNLDRPEDSS